MSKKSYLEKHNKLRATIELKIKEKVLCKGVESSFNTNNVLKVTECQFNLYGNRYLIEIGYEELIDNEGYTYSFDVLNTEKFCELADEIL